MRSWSARTGIVLQTLHLVFCSGPDRVKEIFSKLREGRGWEQDPFSVLLLVSPTVRASGLLLKQVQDSVSKASFLKLLTALSTPGRRQLAPLCSPEHLGCLAWRYLGAVIRSQGSLQFSPPGLACCRPGRVMALGVLTHTHTHNAIETKENLVNPQKSRFLSNFAAFVHEPLGIEVASDLLPAPAWGWEEGDDRSAFAEAERKAPPPLASQPWKLRPEPMGCPHSGRSPCDSFFTAIAAETQGLVIQNTNAYRNIYRGLVVVHALCHGSWPQLCPQPWRYRGGSGKIGLFSLVMRTNKGTACNFTPRPLG